MVSHVFMVFKIGSEAIKVGFPEDRCDRSHRKWCTFQTFQFIHRDQLHGSIIGRWYWYVSGRFKNWTPAISPFWKWPLAVNPIILDRPTSDVNWLSCSCWPYWQGYLCLSVFQVWFRWGKLSCMKVDGSVSRPRNPWAQILIGTDCRASRCV